MRFFNFDSKFSTILSKISDAVILNLMWIVASLPIVTIGAATNALYETLQIVLLRDECSLWQIFWGAYKRKIGSAIIQTILYGCALVGSLTILLAGYMYYPDAEWIGALYLVLIVFTFVIVGMAAYHFCILRSTQLPFGKQFVVAFVLALKHLPTTFLLVSFTVAIVLLVEWFAVFLFLLPVVVAWLAGRSLERVAAKYPNLILREMFDDTQTQN